MNTKRSEFSNNKACKIALNMRELSSLDIMKRWQDSDERVSKTNSICTMQSKN